MTTPTDNPLLPDPDRLRARLAELAREQHLLRKVLRTVVRGAPSVGLFQTNSCEAPVRERGGDGGE